MHLSSPSSSDSHSFDCTLATVLRSLQVSRCGSSQNEQVKRLVGDNAVRCVNPGAEHLMITVVASLLST